jgi:hypothetical protein
MAGFLLFCVCSSQLLPPFPLYMLIIQH